MKRLVLAASLVLLPVAALAADGPGVTLGVLAGGGWTTHDVELLDYDHEGSGAIFGIQLGLDHRVNQLVFGVEGDFSFSNIEAEDTVMFTGIPGASSTTDISHEIKNFSTVRVKVGRMFGNILPYATGGWALARNKSSASAVLSGFGALSGSYEGDETNTHQGWTLGAGVAVQTSERISVKVEYLYADLGEETYVALPALDPIARTHELTARILRAGVTVKF